MIFKDIKTTKRFLIIHLLFILPLISGYSHAAFIVFLLTYVLRVFAVVGVLHRYFSHRSYQTSKFFHFFLGLISCLANQRGPLWWASHHRYHHAHSDTTEDVHSPVHYGFLHSHIGWLFDKSNYPVKSQFVKDLSLLRGNIWLERNYLWVFISSSFFISFIGYFLNLKYPALHTSGFQFFSWGVVLSTLCCNHMTMATNSLVHIFGYQRYKDTEDNSRNIWWFFPALGANWHNNHHRYPHSSRSGHVYWEYDPIYWSLYILATFGLIWNLKVTSIRSGVAESYIIFKK